VAEAEARAQREARVPWPDRWLLDALRQQGHPAVDRLRAAPSAWESAEAAGATTRELLDLVCAISGARPADVTPVGPGHAPLLSPVLARRYSVVPLRVDGVTLEVATANPLSMHLERDLAFAAARPVKLLVAPPAELRRAHERVYGLAPGTTAAARIEWVVREGAAGPVSAPTRGTVVDSLDRLIADALDQRASDMHFEPKEDALLVRFRVDGVLHDVTRIANDLAPLLMSRLKVVAGLDISDRRRPQDGRASTRVDGRMVDLRISTLPLGDRAEKAVVRILDARATAAGLGDLGSLPAETLRVEKLLGENEGIVLVTGPTGSGKTTTLYAALNVARTGHTNIVTVEDPIEYKLDGINQVQVNERSGLGFASALRSIMRQDPDVILVGEIRDAETAGMAIKAGLTGHLVLSTLHTIDAPSAVGRLIDIGVDVGALSGALKGIIAQRLVRRLCETCATTVGLAELPVAQQSLLMGRKTDKLRRGAGCDACRGTGYRGRLVVAEVLVVNDALRTAITRRADRVELMEIAKQGGMTPIWEAGIRRVIEGQTSLSELLDNIPVPTTESSGGQEDVDAVLAKLLGRGASAPTAPATATAPAPAASSATTPPPARRSAAIPIGAPRVLVANDDREARRTIRAALEAAGYAVVEAADGEAALNAARRLKPALLVTELVLPRLDGYALIQQVTQDCAIPIVAFTVETDAGAHEWAREVGCRQVVAAGDGADALAAAVKDSLP
jgi:type II secretory ATPase GspE/PulE/Tfp pilus assembly ATPase PilB-like protein